MFEIYKMIDGKFERTFEWEYMNNMEIGTFFKSDGAILMVEEKRKKNGMNSVVCSFVCKL